MKKEIEKIVKENLKDIIQYRRDIHMNPELGFEEKQTTKYIENVLNKLGLKNTSVAIKRTQTGVYVDIDSNKPGKTLLFRADIDALPMQEVSDVEYKSKIPGVAHSCGHDGHVANLLGVATVLMQLKDQFKGKVRLLFQPAEEGPDLGGAIEVVNENQVLKGVDNAMALHLKGAGDFGKIYFREKEMYAGFIDYKIKIFSSGGHASDPHKCPDPIYIGASLVTQFQGIMTKIKAPLDSAVLSVGMFNAGSNPNIIPMECEIAGTIRVFDFKLGKKIVETMQKLTDGICQAYNAKYDFSYFEGYPPCLNDCHLTKFAYDETCAFLGKENVEIMQEPWFGAEDFAFIAQKVPSTYFMVGIHEKNKPEPLHHSGTFAWNDEVLFTSVCTSVNLILQYLNKY